MTAAYIPMYRKYIAMGLVGLVGLMGGLPQQAFAQGANDYDTNGNNLIEVDSLTKLDAIRYDLDGDGVANTTTPSYTAAFPDPLIIELPGERDLQGL